MAFVTTRERNQDDARTSAMQFLRLVLSAISCLIVASYVSSSAKASWTICYTGPLAYAGCQGSFATRSECQAWQSRDPYASYCTGYDDTRTQSPPRPPVDTGYSVATRLNNEGNALLAKGKCAAAMGKYQAALKKSPRDSVIKNNLAIAQSCLAGQKAASEGTKSNEEGNRLYERGKCADAIEKYQKALKFVPKNKVFRNNLANAKACLAAQKARKANEEGHARWKACDIVGAVAKYQRALELTPSDDVSAKNLAAAKRELREATTPGSFLDAYDFLVPRAADEPEPWCTYDGIRRYLIAHDPNNSQWRALAANEEGLALLDANDFSGAIVKFRLARDLLPNDKVIRQNLARAESWSKEQEGRKLFQRGDYAGALAKYREGLKFDPENVSIKGSITEAETQQKVHSAQSPKPSINSPNPPDDTTSSPGDGEGTVSSSSERFCGFFGSGSCEPVDVGPARTNRVVHANKALQELSMMITANQSAASSKDKPNRMRYEAECGFNSSDPLDCGTPAAGFSIPEPPDPTREYSSEVKVLIESLEKIPQARDNEEINDNLKKLDDNVRLRDLIDSQRERIQKQLDEGKGDLKSLADEKRKLDADREHTVQGIEVGKKKIDEVLLNLGVGPIAKPND